MDVLSLQDTALNQCHTDWSNIVNETLWYGMEEILNTVQLDFN